MNKLLQCQLREHFGGADRVPENFSKLLNVISGPYDDYEKDRKMVELSIELNSKEMIELSSELKKEKEELKKAHKELKTFFEDINEIVFTIDMVTNRLIQTSAACEKIYGYSPAEFMSDNDLWCKIIYPEDKHIPEQLFQQLRRGKPVINQYRIIHKDKSIRWIENKVIPTPGTDGRLVRINGVTSDITERKQAEYKLIITSNELQQALGDINKIMDSSLDVICAVDEEGYFIKVSAACETIWGYKADELIGKLVIDFVCPDDHEKTQKAAVDVIAGNNMINFENRYIRKDGSLVPINWSARWDPRDRIRYGVARDATEKKRSEKALEVQRQRYNNLFLQAPSCIGALKGAAHIFEMANPLYLQLIGKDNIIGKSVKEVLPEIADQGFIELLDGVYKTGKSFSANEMLIKLDKRGNGELIDTYLNFIYEANRNHEGVIEGIFFFAIDVTEQVLSRKKIEKSELRYRSLIEQATDAVCIADSAMKFIDVNSYACEFLGYSKEEALQLSVTDILFTEDLASNPFKYDDVQPNEIIRNERRFKRKDGTSVIMEVSTRLTEDGRFIMFGHDISERKKSEEALRESEKRLRQIIDLVPHFIFAKDAKGKFVLANESVAEAYGSTVEGLIGKTDADFNPNAGEVEHFIREDLKVINSGNAEHNIEETMTDADGNVRVLLTTKIPYTSPGLDAPGVLGVCVDISERKKADEALRLAQFTIENTTHAIYWIKSDGSFHMVNNAATQMLGFTFEELMNLNVPGIDPFYNKEVWDGFWQAIINQKFMRLITKHIRKDGTWIDVQIDTHYFRFENLEMSCAFVSDITEKKTAETLLKNSEEKYRQIVETAQEGIWLIDENNKTSFVNKRMCEMLGYSQEEIIGKEVFYFLDEEGKRIAEESIEKRKKGGSDIMVFKFITNAGAVLWTYISYSSVLDDNGKYIGSLAMITDITQRKLQEDLLQKSEANLEMKNHQLEQKNKELEQFVYVASHDLQEPLRTTSSFAELLQQQYKGRLDEKADQYLTFIIQSSDRMKVLINDLLDYSRIGRKKEREKVDCNIIMQEVLADLGAAIKETGAEIKVGSLPVINGYPTEIKQLFQNLVMNAVKFRKVNTSPQIKVSAYKKDGYWEFTCKDNGIGIEEQHKERIFVIFQRLHTRTEYEGSGIGLAHSKKIVELHGGKIWVESVPGEGTTFHFKIP